MARGQQTLPYAIRPMDWQDLDQVADIEREAFPTLWPGTSYRREMRNRAAEYVVCAHADERVLLAPAPPKRGLMDVLRRRKGRAPEPQERELLAGYMGLWYLAGEAHIVSIAVREESRGLGLGDLLLISAIEMAIRREMEVLTLEVRVSNEPAISLYEKYGFHKVGLRRGYYSDNHEDAHIMSTDSLRSEALLSEFKRLVDAHEERRGESGRRYL